MYGNYERDMYKQLEETIERNEKLGKENKELREENAYLRKQLKNWEENFEARVNKVVEEAVAKATAPLIAKIEEQDKVIKDQQNEIMRLKTQIDKNSSNSSKPPSSNGFKKIPNNRKKGTRKQGGQKGHTGHTLTVPKNLDELVQKGIAEHKIISEVKENEPYISDWTVDIQFKTIYTEHRRAIGTLPKIQYGENIKTLAVYLNTVGIIALKRLSEFFRELTGGLITVSKAALENFIHTKAQEINLHAFVQDILNGKVTHIDESPIRSSERPNADGLLETAHNTTFQAYIRTYSNSRTTVLTASGNKSEQSVRDDNILTRFYGIISQDHEAKFYKFGSSHATCGAHLSRELKGMSELFMLSWSDDVRCLFQEMNNKKNEDIRNEVNYCEQALLCHFEERYDDLVSKGKEMLDSMTKKSFGFDELRRMVNRLTEYKDCYLLFIRDYDAPFTNNEAERDLRHCKTKQKVSGCFRSWQGVMDYCKIRSLLATAKKRNLNLLAALADPYSLCFCSAGQ